MPEIIIAMPESAEKISPYTKGRMMTTAPMAAVRAFMTSSVYTAFLPFFAITKDSLQTSAEFATAMLPGSRGITETGVLAKSRKLIPLIMKSIPKGKSHHCALFCRSLTKNTIISITPAIPSARPTALLSVATLIVRKSTKRSPHAATNMLRAIYAPLLWRIELKSGFLIFSIFFITALYFIT